MATESYLAKLLTLFVRKNGGSIRIPASDLMSEDVGSGISVHWDDDSKELVISYIPKGSKLFPIKEGETWLATKAPTPPPAITQTQPLSRDELLQRIWTESAGTPTNSESLSGKPQEGKGRVITLNDERTANIELERQKAAALREIEEFQPSSQRTTRPVRTPSRALETFLKP